MSNDRGFSLIELLIVVGVILIIAAISIPNLIRARMAANESSAVSSIRTMMTAEAAYATAYPSIGYADLANLGGAIPCSPNSTTACLIDSVLTLGIKSGYGFNAVGGTQANGINTSFVVGAAPLSPDITGVRRFCGVNDNVIHYDLNPGMSSAVPTAADCGNAPFVGQVIQ
jgi:prepilin-type N-terminal cleavage/methylation domain-containing protein